MVDTTDENKPNENKKPSEYQKNLEEIKRLVKEERRLIIEEAKKKLKGLEESKRKIILDAAQQLEDHGTPLGLILPLLIEGLRGYNVSERYIRECLGKELEKEEEEHKKEQKKVSVESGTSSEIEDKKVLVVSSTGEQSQGPHIPEAEVFTPRINIPSPVNIFDKDDKAEEIEIGQAVTTEWTKLDFNGEQWRKIWSCKTNNQAYVYLRINGSNIEIRRANE